MTLHSYIPLSALTLLLSGCNATEPSQSTADTIAQSTPMVQPTAQHQTKQPMKSPNGVVRIGQGPPDVPKGLSSSENLESTWMAHKAKWTNITATNKAQKRAGCPDSDGDGFPSAKICGDILGPKEADCDDTNAEVTPLNEAYIPSGLVMLGSESSHAGADEKPAHIVMLSGYCLDIKEVSTEQWSQWMLKEGHKPSGKDVRNLTAELQPKPGRELHPAEGVLWAEASAFCQAQGKSLPTEAQWEKSARGGCEGGASPSCEEIELRPYPWGASQPSCAVANHQISTSFPPKLCLSDTVPVDKKSSEGPYGHQQLAGNVWEYVADVWHPGTYAHRSGSAELITDPIGPAPQENSFHVLKGGGWNTFSTNMRVANRFHDLVLGSATGFRCARSFSKQQTEPVPALKQSSVGGKILSQSPLKGRALYVSAFDAKDADANGRMSPGMSPMAELRLQPNGELEQSFSLVLPHGTYIISAALDAGSGAQKDDYVAASGSGGFGNAKQNPVTINSNKSALTIELQSPPQHPNHGPKRQHQHPPR